MEFNQERMCVKICFSPLIKVIWARVSVSGSSQSSSSNYISEKGSEYSISFNQGLLRMPDRFRQKRSTQELKYQH